MKCKVCERENPEGALFCGSCGNSFEEENVQQTSEIIYTEQPYANEPAYVTANRSTLTSRMIRASMFDAHTFEEVEADKSATKQALTVVLIVALLASLGHLISGSLVGLLLNFVACLAFWSIWAYMAYFIGTKLLPEETTDADWGELLRTTGFAWSPWTLNILTIVAPILFIPLLMWVFGLMVMAIRQALDYKSTLRAVAVSIISFIPAIFTFSLIMNVILNILGVETANQ